MAKSTNNNTFKNYDDEGPRKRGRPPKSASAPKNARNMDDVQSNIEMTVIKIDRDGTTHEDTTNIIMNSDNIDEGESLRVADEVDTNASVDFPSDNVDSIDSIDDLVTYTDEPIDPSPEQLEYVEDINEHFKENILNEVVNEKQLSAADKLFIRQHPNWPLKKLAVHLNKGQQLIFEYRNSIPNNIEDLQVYKKKEMIEQLKKKQEYKIIQNVFDSAELKFFENKYADLVMQFNEDVMPTEEMQIFQVLRLEILMNRNMQDRKNLTMQVSDIRNKIESLRKDTSSDAQEQRIKLYERLDAANGAQRNLTTEHKDLLTQQNALQKDLKATRDQRLQKLEKTQKDFLSLIKMIADDEKREIENKELRLIKAATQKTEKELQELHTFVDNTVNRVVLNSEAIMHEIITEENDLTNSKYAEKIAEQQRLQDEYDKIILNLSEAQYKKIKDIIMKDIPQRYLHDDLYILNKIAEYRYREIYRYRKNKVTAEIDNEMEIAKMDNNEIVEEGENTLNIENTENTENTLNTGCGINEMGGYTLEGAAPYEHYKDNECGVY